MKASTALNKHTDKVGYGARLVTGKSDFTRLLRNICCVHNINKSCESDSKVFSLFHIL